MNIGWRCKESGRLGKGGDATPHKYAVIVLPNGREGPTREFLCLCPHVLPGLGGNACDIDLDATGAVKVAGAAPE